ncbi:MAG: ABC transporter substrate-binding protein [Alphaproteobacteria bacterium]|nr:ABC transporter substrate-binding protein [Alphaproteobacteria bacterium]
MATQAAKLAITFGCGLYDRMLPLYTGAVAPEGIDLDFVIADSPRQLFDRMTGPEPFDVAEMSGSEYLARFAAGRCPFVAIPVFPSRLFRHGFITVNRHAGIETPKDLEGRRVGTVIYTQTASVWTRGMLAHDYGVDLSAIHWVQGDLDKPGLHTEAEIMPLLKPADIVPNESDKSLEGLLAAGEIDAIVSPRMPLGFGKNPDIVRLFPDFQAVELDYYRRTGIFPIMHLVVIRREIYDAHPFVAASLYAAFEEAKALAMARLDNRSGTLPFMLPWIKAHVEALKREFGDDPWPYGVEANRVTLEAFITYLVEQDMIAEAIPIEDLFVEV